MERNEPMDWKELFSSRKVRTVMVAILGIYMIATAVEAPERIVTLTAIISIAALGALNTLSQALLDWKHPKGSPPEAGPEINPIEKQPS